jgi:hypothetical protein
MFQRMMQEAQSGDVIVVYKLDRLTRSVRDLDDLLREFEARFSDCLSNNDERCREHGTKSKRLKVSPSASHS